MTTALTTTDLARRLGVDRRTIQRWCRERRIPHLRIGTNTIRFLQQHVEEIEQAYSSKVVEHRPEADVPNPAFEPYITVVPMRRPNDAA